ncbi:MAG: ABC transporter ATP-binding protein [Lachnospiraceae bacterium]|nr:ABC transporter ATP-binding protein [Lachnospiraceae bacterium]
MKRMRKIYYIALKYSYLFVLATLLAIVLSEMVVAASELISQSINTLTVGQKVDTKELLIRAGIITVASMGVAFLKSLSGELFSIKVQKECKSVAVKCFEKVQYRFFESNSGAIINKLTSDISDIGKLMSETLPEMVQHTVTIIVMSIALIRINKYIFLGIIIVFPIAAFLSNIIARKINELAKKRKGKYDELSDIALDNIEGIEIARSYGLESILGKRVSIKAKEILGNEYSRNRYQALANGLTSLIRWVPTIICALIALSLSINNIISLGELMAFLVLFGKISSPLSELPFIIIDAREMMISVKRIEELINLPKERSGSYSIQDISKVKDIIRLDNIGFTYDSAGEASVLDDISMTIHKGDVVAIVGSSGSGKSTLMKILCGFERCQKGEYYLCEHSIEEWNIDSARSLISYVPQDSYLFPCTIAENIAIGFENIDEMLVENVCKKAGIAEMISELPDGYHTEVGERGVKLSGGERQRLAIARALYKNAPIILLDEPTSALDEETEKIISKTIYEDPEKTVIVIAHRLSTIQDADRIYCMKDGRIVETGTHRELIAMDGVYAALYSREVQNS